MKNLYIAGSLFNEAEVNQRIKEGNMNNKEFLQYICESIVDITNKGGNIYWRN